MNRYPRGKFILLLVVLVVCGLYALPNLYPDAPAIQITRSEAGVQVSQDAISRLNVVLDEAGIGYGAGEAVGDSWLLRLDDSEAQLRARALAERTLGRDYVVALNLAPTTPPWLRAIGASPVGLGLDLRGGVHFLLQVDMDTAIDQRLDAWAAELHVLLRDEGIRYREVTYEGHEVIARFDNAEDVDAAQRVVGTQFVEFSQRREYEQNQLRFTLTET